MKYRETIFWLTIKVHVSFKMTCMQNNFEFEFFNRQKKFQEYFFTYFSAFIYKIKYAFYFSA